MSLKLRVRSSEKGGTCGRRRKLVEGVGKDEEKVEEVLEICAERSVSGLGKEKGWREREKVQGTKRS